MPFSRRQFTQSTAFSLGATLSGIAMAKNIEFISSPEDSSAELIAQDEAFWARVAAQYPKPGDFCNLENGYYGVISEPVARRYRQLTLELNEQSSYLLRTTYKPKKEEARKELAKVIGVDYGELALTRGGTEALQNLISGYRGLSNGSAVLYADLDYYSCKYAMNWLANRHGAEVIKMDIPEPAERQAVIDAYESILSRNPHIRLMLLTHVSNRTGLLLPVKEIIEVANAYNVDVILDAAHSFGQVDCDFSTLGAKFIGFSLHKWIGAPLGLGCIFIAKDRLEDIDPCLGDELYGVDDTRSRAHSGTLNIVPFLTLPTALAYHQRLGLKNKACRLRYLRDLWVNDLADLAEVEVLTPSNGNMSAGITSFRLRGRKSQTENEKLASDLMDLGYFTVRRGGVAGGDCVRVTPALFTSSQEVRGFARAVRNLVGRYFKYGRQRNSEKIVR